MKKVYITNTASIDSISGISDNTLPENIAQPGGNRIACLEPDYKEYVADAGTRRRMSRAVKMGVAAAVHCLAQTEKKPDAIITATGLGCLGDTEKFLKTLIENNEQLLNPTPFIQSTFNTVGAQVAIGQSNNGYNMTYVHRGFAFENALTDALLQLREGEAESILAGSYEETTDTSFEIMQRLGFWRQGAKCGEGAHFFTLSTQANDVNPVELKGVLSILTEDKNLLNDKLSAFLQANNTTTDEIDTLVSGSLASPDSFYAIIENRFPNANLLRFKHLTGDYQTVSAFATYLAVQILQEESIPAFLLAKNGNRKSCKLLVYNHYLGTNHSFVLLGK
ncbi:MAG: beta-ketoacyl synthase chain length factor [Prevotellaceae bacterium]|jgi:hypothetical protein|nr:beta-ketoacyl synthase chain length factor [Prevotellaceae bacterium]